jgi:DNA-binding HxlR family transcriptional regulator
MCRPIHGCGLESALVVVGGKWKPIVLWRLAGARRRFGKLRRLVEGIREKMLIQQLREMEADGIVARKDFHEIPPRVEYALHLATPVGRVDVVHAEPASVDPTEARKATVRRLGRSDRNRPLNRRRGRLNPPGQVEHPGTQLLAIVDPVPRAVAQDGLPIATEKNHRSSPWRMFTGGGHRRG